MGALSGIYDCDFVQPVAKIKENLSVWTTLQWSHFVIDYIEPMPPGPASLIDMVVIAGATNIPALGTITKRVIAALQMASNEIVHIRWEPVDNVEGVLWEQSGQLKFNSKNLSSRVNWQTRLWDPFLASTTFWIVGSNRDMNLEVRNPNAFALPQARFMFYGHRYLVTPWDFCKLSQQTQNLLAKGDPPTVKQYLGATAWVPAEGRMA